MIEAVIAYDPITGKFYTNSVGSNVTESTANADLIDMTISVWERLEFVKCTIIPTLEQVGKRRNYVDA